MFQKYSMRWISFLTSFGKVSGSCHMSCHVNDRTSMQAETGFFDLGYVSDAEGCRGHGRWELV